MPALLYVMLANIAMVLIGGIWTVKFMDQRRLDKRHRACYKITFPSGDIALDQLDAWLRTVHGVLSSNSRVSGRTTSVMELWSVGGMKTARIKVPHEHVEALKDQLHAAVPGLRLEVEDHPPRRVWTSAVEVGMSNKSRPLSLTSPHADSQRIITSLGPLSETETVMLQWVITGARRHRLPVHKETQTDDFNPTHWAGGRGANKDEVNERRAKLAELNMLAVLRVAAQADTEERAVDLVHRVRNAFAPVGTAQNHFTKRMLPRKELQHRLDYGAGSTSWPIQVTTQELAHLLGWPLDGAASTVVGFAPGRSTDLPPTEDVARVGIHLGKATYSGQERPVALGYDEALMHTLILGRTGTGKSELMAGISRQIMEQGHGLVLMEKAGDLYSKVLSYVPLSRRDDVIVFEMADVVRPLGFNIFDQGNPQAAVDSLMSLLRHRIGDHNLGVWGKEGIQRALQTVAATPGLTVVDVPVLLNPRTPSEEAWVKEVSRNVKDPDLARWWQMQNERPAAERAKRAEPVESRIGEFTADPTLRNIIGQSKSSFNWDDVLKDGKILLISFKGVADEAVSMACAIFMTQAWASIKRKEEGGKRTYFMLDEAAEFMNLPIDLEAMFEQARKHGAGIFMANQQLEQLQPRSLETTAINNTRSKIVFQTYTGDAARMRREMGGKRLTEEDFTMRPMYQAVVQLMNQAGVAPAVSIQTPPPGAPNGIALELQHESARRYGTLRDEVERQIEARRRPTPKPRGPQPVMPDKGIFGDL